VPVYLDLMTRMDKKSAEDAAKDITDKFVDAAKDINGTVGNILEKMFDGIDGSKGREQIKSLQDEYQKLAKAAGDAERQQVSSAGNVEVAIKRLHEAHDKYGASASQTAVAENRLTAAWAQSSQAAMAAAAASKTAAGAHDALAAASSGAAEGASMMGGPMLAAAAAVAAAGDAAYEAGKKLFDMGEQWADVSDRITFATGKVGADVKAMTDQIADIANHTAAPIDTIGQVYTQLTRIKDLNGETLNDLTKQISDFDQMNKDAPVNVQLFTRTMQEFHVPADQMGKDLDLMNSAAQDGQVPLNELLTTMRDAGPTADIAGLSFGQMANVLAAVEASGVNVDNALKGIKMGLGNLATDSPKLQKLIKFGPDENDLQRLKDVIQKIQEMHNAGDDVGAIDLGKTVFGRSWTDIGQAIIDAKLNVDDLNTSLGNGGRTIEAQRTATQRFGDDWQKVKNQITDALKPLSEDVFKTLDDGLRGFSTLLEALVHGDAWKVLRSSFGLDPVPQQDGHTVPKTPSHPGPPGAPGPNVPSGSNTPAVPTGPDISTAAPYHPLDLNPADKPRGAETYDEWVNSQKAVQSALNRQSDTGEQLAAAQARQKDLLDGGKATQEELNSVSEEINKAKRDNLQATQDLTIAEQKYSEDANKKTKGKSDNPFDDYDPFKEATKHSTGLIPQLAGLLAAGAVNQALGNPYGKMQAAKKGEDPSNPLYVSDVAGGTTGGVPGYLSKLFANNAAGQPTPDSATGLSPSNAPAGSIPQMIPGQPKAGPPVSPNVALQSHSESMKTPSGATVVSDGNIPSGLKDAEALAKSASGQKYGYGGVGDEKSGGLYDCSGYMSAIYGALTGKPMPKQRFFTTESDFSKLGFEKGFDPNSDFNIGVHHGGGGPNSHMAGTLGGVNVESGGPKDMTQYGGSAAGATTSEFEDHWHLPNSAIVGDGAVPDAPQPPKGYATGGLAPSDTVPAMLTPKEFVVKKDAAEKHLPELQAMNAGQDDPHKPTPDRVSPTTTGPGASSRGPLGSVTPPPPGPRIGQGQGPGFGISGGIIGMAETAAIMAAMAAGGMAIGGIVPDSPGGVGQSAGASVGGGAPPGGGTTGGKGGAPSGGGGDPMTAVINRTVGLFGQYGGIAAQGLMSSLIPGASQKGGISDGGILSKLAGGIAGAHPSAPNTAGNTAVPLAPPGGGPGSTGDTHNHIGMQAGVSIGTLVNQNGQSGTDLANDLAFKGYSGYGGR
jgi:TP901 family phage tail tape measure protein